jgi:hypothetical protein
VKVDIDPLGRDDVLHSLLSEAGHAQASHFRSGAGLVIQPVATGEFVAGTRNVL